MQWHDLRDPMDPELDRLAELYRLHSLHVEDCRHGGQSAKFEDNGHYIFVVLKPVWKLPDGAIRFSDLYLFLGKDFFISVHEKESPPLLHTLDQLRDSAAVQRADRLFYRITDAVVDGYSPMLDRIDDQIETLEEEVLGDPTPGSLERIFAVKRSLIEIRRILANTRDVASHLQRTESDLIGRDLWAFLRDVYDHVARNLDSVEMQRDLLSGAMEIYLSSAAQRTNQVMKVLTILGTIALPALVISGFYGMNLSGLPYAGSPAGAFVAAGIMGLSTLVLLVVLRLLKWL